MKKCFNVWCEPSHVRSLSANPATRRAFDNVNSFTFAGGGHVTGLSRCCQIRSLFGAMNELGRAHPLQRAAVIKQGALVEEILPAQQAVNVQFCGGRNKNPAVR